MLWEADSGFTSHKNTTAAYDKDGNLVGIELGIREKGASAHFKAMSDTAKAFPDQGFTSRVFANLNGSNLLFPDWPDGGYYLGNLAAHPDARGRGIGEKLIQNCFEQAKAAGLTAVALDVEANNPAGLMGIIDWCEWGWIPDGLTRFGMRRLMAGRLRDSHRWDDAAREKALEQFLADRRKGPIAIGTDDANDQHYEVPPEFFLKSLGPRLKYSSCYFADETTTLPQAEDAMLAMTAERAGIQDGMDILDLGCGWGSVTLYLLEHFPGVTVTSVSNSKDQGDYIRAQAEARGFKDRSHVITADINHFVAPGQYDRIVSVEMFEHMRNYQALLSKTMSWLKPDGRLFVHIFCHKLIAYTFEDEEGTDWMARFFFTGGVMPHFDLFHGFPDLVSVEDRWWVNGTHYEKTLNAWLALLDERREEIETLFAEHYPVDTPAIWAQRWRMFYMASAELFGFGKGNQAGEEWGVGHYLLKRP
ncbi:unnamed protein product [Symbiodinium microadriaticum]|nr:unnamed protein product [Symbiodinium microadriaticum]